MKKTGSWARAARSSALALGLCLGCASAPPPSPFTAPARGDRAAPIDLGLACLGGRVQLSSLRGQAVLIVAITTENLASQALLRNVDRVAAAHPEGVVALAFAGDRMPERELTTVLETYRDVAGLQRVRLCGADDSIRRGESDLGAIERVPTLYFLNRAGAVARRVEGVPTVAELDAMVAPALPPGR